MTVHDFTVQAADGTSVSLGDYAGKHLLIVNVASRCGLTPQYTGLEALQRDLGDRGLQVLGFPCNQFGEQEPGSAEEIQQFCSTSYGVSFPVLAKIEVNGPAADPLYEYLRETKPGDIAWNFTKFLIGPDGAVVERFEPRTTPEQLRPQVEAALAA
ncbi:MAG TPA: glutathione peroxidase [Jatrophihabitans sp.]|jgi:glutathione peroxidase